MKKHNVAFQKNLGFRFATTQKSKEVQSQGLCSTVADDLDNNDNAYNVKTVHFKDLSRYVCKDVLGLEEDTLFLPCIAKELDGNFNELLSDGVKEQPLLKFAGDVCKSLGREYLNLKVAINSARFCHELITGGMQITDILTNYERNEGFVVSINGTKLKITFPWRDLVKHADNIMFSGTPFMAFPLFNRKCYLVHVFKHLAVEVSGNVMASFQLYASYLKQINEVKG